MRLAIVPALLLLFSSCSLLEPLLGQAQDMPLVPLDKAHEALDAADADGDGKLSWNEIEAWIDGLRQRPQP